MSFLCMWGLGLLFLALRFTSSPARTCINPITTVWHEIAHPLIASGDFYSGRFLNASLFNRTGSLLLMQMRNLSVFFSIAPWKIFTEACLVIPSLAPSMRAAAPKFLLRVGFSLEVTLGDGLRATQGQGRVGSSERGWIFLFSVLFVCFLYTQRGKPHHQALSCFFS